MPPVMGAAAFLMVEYVGIKYTDVVKHAFIPAIISYIALLYMVHLEALKANMKALEKPIKRNISQSLIMYGIVISSILIVSGASYYLVKAINDFSGEYAFYVISGLLFIAYIAAIWYASKFPDLEKDDPESEIVKLPETLPTVSTGIYFILPIVVLIWCLMIEMLSPGLSAFWATTAMIFILLTQKPLKEFFRKSYQYGEAFKSGILDFVDGMITGARNMIGIAVATAAAGIIVGSVSLTGVGQVLTEVVEVLSGGSLILILLFTAIICLVLGMGLPTTANYIVVASLMASVVVDLGAANGLFVPLIAVHLFVFYFGIMADVTPPVGLASFAAAAISGDDPIRTGLQAFTYSLRTAILPFFFIFNNELILVGVDSFLEGLWVFIYATVGILIFSSGLQGFLLTKNKLIETVLLIAVAVTIFVPSIWFKVFLPKYQSKNLANFEQVIGGLDEKSRLRLLVDAYDFDGKKSSFDTYIPGNIAGKDAEGKLFNYGLELGETTERGIQVEYVDFNSDAERGGFNTINYDKFIITAIQTPNKAPFNPKLLFIPALLVFAGIYMAQSVRKRQKEALESAYA
jgi:TRAP transporter 4TM/12TM fusion protein